MSSYYSKAFCCRHFNFFVNSIRKNRIAKVEKYIKIQPITFALFLASAVLIFAF